MDTSILIVDDEEAIRVSLANALGEEGYTILEAGSGEEALAIIRQKGPDLMLLDRKLPKIEGLEVLKQAKKIQDDIVVIVMTIISATILGFFDLVWSKFTQFIYGG